eukprot:s316_g4.t1
MVSAKQWKRWCRQFEWLRGRPGHARCSVCPGYECDDVYMRSQLQQHAQSKCHLTRGQGGCPSAAEFNRLLDERCQGTSLRRSEFGAFKASKLLWCLSESVKEELKARMAHGLLTASISQDGQGAGLGIRACIVSTDRGVSTSTGDIRRFVCSKKVKVWCSFVLCQGPKCQVQATSMVLAYSKKELSGSHNLAKATRSALCKFFTKRRCPPKGWGGPKSRSEPNLMKKFAQHVATWQHIH